MLQKIKDIKWLLIHLPKLYKKYKNKTDCNLYYVLVKFIYYKLAYNKHIMAHPKVKIEGVENIILKGSLEIGINEFGIFLNSDQTLLKIRGTLKINSSHYSIGRGCRIYIAEDAIVEFGEKGHITGFSNMIVSNRLIIGDDCSISWGCQFLDDDHQEILYHRKQEKENEIIIGNHVWIGSGVQIYKTTNIPDGCVIAANSVLRGVFNEPNSLIGGNPAKIIKTDIEWK